jgi:hypothetical protein
MADICAELESAGAAGDLPRVQKLLERLEAEFEHVHAALKAELRRRV